LPNDLPYLFLDVRADVIRGDRDALVTLRGAINDALRRGSADADFSDGDGDDFNLIVTRTGA
jgi:hypothetical protein